MILIGLPNIGRKERNEFVALCDLDAFADGLGKLARGRPVSLSEVAAAGHQ
jgi:hypothetical protein